MPAAQGHDVDDGEAAECRLWAPVDGVATADHAKVVVGAALAMLLSAAAASPQPELAKEMGSLAQLLNQTAPWLKCASLHHSDP